MKLSHLAILAALLPAALWAEKSAKELFKDAQRAERAGQIELAYVLYAEAAAKDPRNIEYWAHAQELKPLASKRFEQSLPPEIKPPAPTLDASVVGSLSDAELAEARSLRQPPHVNPALGVKDFDLRGDSQALIEAVVREFHLRVVFDPGFQPKPNMRLHLEQVNFEEALAAVEASTGTFAVPVNSELILVAEDTTQKRTDLDRTAATVISVPEPFDIKDVQEIATGVRGILDVQRLLVDSQRRLILIRDRVTKVMLAEKIVEDLMKPKAQVAIEVELIESDAQSSMTYGLNLPSTFPLVWFGTSSYFTTTYPAGFTDYLTFGAGHSLLGIGLTNSTLFANFSKSTTVTLLRSEIVAADGATASFHVGEKYPIITNGYFGNTTGSGTVYTPPPTISFEDLGLLLKLTPHVHSMDELSLDITTEFKLLGSSSNDGIPVISNRKYESKIRVRTGEWAVIAGLMDDEEGKTLTGLPGLIALPGLRNDNRTRTRGDTLIVLKPHLLSLPPTESVVRAAWFGTEAHPRTPL